MWMISLAVLGGVLGWFVWSVKRDKPLMWPAISAALACASTSWTYFPLGDGWPIAAAVAFAGLIAPYSLLAWRSYCRDYRAPAPPPRTRDDHEVIP